MKFAVLVVLFCGLLVLAQGKPHSRSAKSHHRREHKDVIKRDDPVRDGILQGERATFIGHQITLNDNEKLVNTYLKGLKEKLYFGAGTQYYLNNHFMKAVEHIKQEELYNVIKAMPKGADLHLHIAAVGDHNWIVKTLMYEEGLYICHDAPSIQFQWRNAGIPNIPCVSGWNKVNEERQSSGNPDQYDNNMLNTLSLTYDDILASGVDQVELWKRFLSKFDIMKGLYTCVEKFPAFLNAFFDNFYNVDNVQYTEIRISYKQTLYSMADGSKQTTEQFLQLFQSVSQAYQDAHPGFVRPRIIMHDQKGSDLISVTKSLALVKDFIAVHPDLIIGYDLVGQEDVGNPISTYQNLFAANPDINYYFHAGETNWEGTQVDLNLIDSIQLGTKRIGHGYAADKHPWVMQQVKERKIAIELSPISNQVLGLVGDFRNHPGSVMFAQDLPIVISSDDPSFWGSTPLSYDFFIIFVIFGGADTDLRTMKQLAINSIEYCGLDDEAKNNLRTLWENKWNQYIDQIIATKHLPLPSS